MNKIQIVFLTICLFGSSGMIYGQDTVYLMKRPKVILQSWYPEFKEFPKLRIGEGKILFTIIPDFEKTRIRDNDINLISLNSAVNIEETDKENQYFVTG